jgi:hypothetical protein
VRQGKGRGMKKIFFLVFLISVLHFCDVVAEPEKATVFSTQGKVSMIPKGSTSSIEAYPGMQLNEGDWIKTDKASSVAISFNEEDSNVVSVKENTLVILKLDGYFKIHLLSGEIYAFLESVEKDESFRVLMPSVVTESASSGWGATTDGSYTNVMVFENQAFICGINMDGSVDDKKFWIDEGFQRKTIKFQDPGAIRPVPKDVATWFKEQVVAHHLEKSLSRDIKTSPPVPASPGRTDNKGPAKDVDAQKEEDFNGSAGPSHHAPGVFVTDGEEINLVEYLYRERLRQR